MSEERRKAILRFLPGLFNSLTKHTIQIRNGKGEG